MSAVPRARRAAPVASRPGRRRGCGSPGHEDQPLTAEPVAARLASYARNRRAVRAEGSLLADLLRERLEQPPVPRLWRFVHLLRVPLDRQYPPVVVHRFQTFDDSVG